MTDLKRKMIEGGRKGGAMTRAMFYPYEGKAVYMRLSVDKEAAEKAASIPETERSRFFTEAIFEEAQRLQKGSAA